MPLFLTNTELSASITKSVKNPCKSLIKGPRMLEDAALLNVEFLDTSSLAENIMVSKPLGTSLGTTTNTCFR